MKYVLCFGNPYILRDSLAQKIAGRIKIKGVKFDSCNSPEEIMFYFGKDFVILDVAEGIKKISIIGNADSLSIRKIFSLHDFDLGFFLKMMQKLNKKRKIRIIGIPEKGNLREIEKELKRILSIRKF